MALFLKKFDDVLIDWISTDQNETFQTTFLTDVRNCHLNPFMGFEDEKWDAPMLS
jgi:hypothetical protein